MEVGLEDADAREVAVAFGEIEAVADGEFVGDFEADEIGLELDLAASAFVEEHACVEAGGVELLQHVGDGGEGFPGVENVVDEQHVAVGDVEGEALEQLGLADGLGVVAIAGDADAIETDGVGNLAQQVGSEEDGAVNDGNYGDFLVAVGGGDLGTEFFDALFDVFFGDEHGFEIGVQGEIFGLGHWWARLMSGVWAQGNWFVPRALVIRPRCLLLDEPLSNLDAKLRLEMRTEIRRVCKEFKLTTVYVTHDQKEALSISDRMAILEGGKILQVGSPKDVYRRPVCRTVAHFIGETDFITGRVLGPDGDFIAVETPIGRFLGVVGDANFKPAAGAEVTLSIRPECWKLGGEPRGHNAVRGRIGDSVYLGEVAQYDFVAAAGGATLKIYELNPRFVGTASDGDLFASVDADDVVILGT